MTLFFLLFIQPAIAVLQWREDSSISDTSRTVIKKLGDALQEQMKGYPLDTSPNIAIASLQIQTQSREAPIEVELPYFFLSGWDRNSYIPKLGVGLHDFLTSQASQIDERYANYEARTLKDCFEENSKPADFCTQLSSIIQEDLTKLEQKEFFPNYLHSEQAEFTFLRKQLPLLINSLDAALITEITLSSLSYIPVCQHCKKTKPHMEQFLASILDLKDHKIPIKINLNQIPDVVILHKDKKKHSLTKEEEEDNDEGNDKISPKKPKTGHNPETKEEEAEDKPSPASPFNLTQLTIGNPLPTLIEVLLPKDQSWKVIKSQLIENQKPDLKALNTMKLQARPPSPKSILCDIINAYVYMFIAAKELGPKKIADIKKNMAQAITNLDNFKKQKENNSKNIAPFFTSMAENKGSEQKNEPIIDKNALMRDVAAHILKLLDQ